MRAVGLMSGTSLDGVDVALIETDGEAIAAIGPSDWRTYTDDERTVLRRAFAEAVTLTERTARPAILAQAEELVTRIHGDVVEAFIAKNELADVDVVGFHGQTVLHRPARGLTIQIGDGEALARRLGRPVVHDFRAADVAAGGEGAPLVPIFHRALAETLACDKPIAVLNIGGVANVTYIDDHNDPVACDTGPRQRPDRRLHAGARRAGVRRRRRDDVARRGRRGLRPPACSPIRSSPASRQSRLTAMRLRSPTWRCRNSRWPTAPRRLAGAFHRRVGGADRAASAAPAEMLGGGGRRRAQPHHHADAGAPSRARDGPDR